MEETKLDSVTITTIDNPYNPFTEFDKWWMFDRDHGYFSNEVLARESKTSPQLSDIENNEEIERAIDEIIRTDVLGVYKKVRESDYNK